MPQTRAIVNKFNISWDMLNMLNMLSDKHKSRKIFLSFSPYLRYLLQSLSLSQNTCLIYLLIFQSIHRAINLSINLQISISLTLEQGVGGSVGPNSRVRS